MFLPVPPRREPEPGSTAPAQSPPISPQPSCPVQTSSTADRLVLALLYASIGGFLGFLVGVYGVAALLPKDPGNVEGPTVAVYLCFCSGVFTGLIGVIVGGRVGWRLGTPHQQ